MSGAAGTGAGVAGYMAAVADAIKACGTIVRVEPEEFQKILSLQERPLVVRNVSKFLSTSYKYLTSYRGLAFYCKSSTELNLPGTVELIQAKKMSIPDL